MDALELTFARKFTSDLNRNRAAQNHVVSSSPIFKTVILQVHANSENQTALLLSEPAFSSLM